MSIEQVEAAVKTGLDELGGEIAKFRHKNDRRHDANEAQLEKLCDIIDGITASGDAARVGGASGASGKALNALGEFAKEGGTGEFETKELSTIVDSEGGVIQRVDQDKNIVGTLPYGRDIFDHVEKVTISTNEFERVFTVRGPDVWKALEKDARPETSAPEYVVQSAKLHDMVANPRVTQTYLDASPGYEVGAHLIREIRVAMREYQAMMAVIGNGDAPDGKGILGAADSYDSDLDRDFGSYQLVDSSVSGGFSADDLVDLTTLLDYRYLNSRSAFYMSREAFAYARKLKDGQGNYLLTDARGDLPTMMMGYPVFVSKYLGGMGAGGKAVVFGDMQQAYAYVEHSGGMRILRDPYTAKPFVHFYTTLLCAGMPTDTRALKVLVCAP